MKRVQGQFHASQQPMRRGVDGVANVVPLRNPARNFIVITTQRTGSSWLMDRLNNIPGTEGHMELFYHSPRREPPRAGRNDYPRFVESRDAAARGRRPLAVFRYLRGLYGRRSATGFKMMYSQLREYPEVLAYVALHRLPVVHLVRNNHLDVLISEEIARITGRSHNTVKEAGGRQKPASVVLDPASVLSGVQRLQKKQQLMRRTLQLLPNAVQEVSYESLCEREETFASLCRFLRIDPELGAAESALVKRQKAPRSEVVGNYDQVRAVLEANGLAHLLK